MKFGLRYCNTGQYVDPKRTLELAQAGVGKNEVHRQTGHVVGLTDVNFEVERGEIFVVMGLSGSGKSTAIRTVRSSSTVSTCRS